MAIYYGARLFEPLHDLFAFLIRLPFPKKAVWSIIILLGVLIISILTNQWILFSIFVIVFALVGFRLLYARLLRPILRYKFWKTHKKELLENGGNNYISSIDDLGLAPAEFDKLRRNIEMGGEVIIADIDQDGFLLSRFGPLAGIQTIPEEEFIKRRRNDLQLIAVGDTVGVKKVFNHWKPFLTELEILKVLSRNCNVPSLLAVDFDENSIVLSYIPGKVIRRELALHGAKILHRDLDDDIQYQDLPKIDKKRKRITSAKTVLEDIVHEENKDNIFAELQKIHQTGVLIHDVKYGNIILEEETGEPFFIDFDFAQQFGYPKGIQGEVKRDIEIERFNYIFDAEKQTRRRLQYEIINSQNEIILSSEQSVNFGKGICVGKTWHIDFGEGLWQYLVKPNLSNIKGSRILDIGCQTPLFSIRILLAGAAEVVCIEQDEQINNYRKFLREGFEWSHSVTLNLKVIKSGFDELDHLTLGSFDLALIEEKLFQQSEENIELMLSRIQRICSKVVIVHGKQSERKSGSNPDSSADGKLLLQLESNGLQVARRVIPRWGEKALTVVQNYSSAVL